MRFGVKISVFGLGYVGAVSAGCLASLGHEVIGVDPAAAKVELTNRGKSPVVEAGLEQLMSDAVREGRRARVGSAPAPAAAAAGGGTPAGR